MENRADGVLWVNPHPTARHDSPAHASEADGWSVCGRRLKGWQSIAPAANVRRFCILCRRTLELRAMGARGGSGAPISASDDPPVLSRVLRVYVAGPYSTIGRVRAWHARLRMHGFRVVSEWADTGVSSGVHPIGARMPDAVLRALWRGNRWAVRRADVLVVIDPEGKGRETYAELGYALELRKRVICWAPPSLSTMQPSVRRIPCCVPTAELEGSLGLDLDLAVFGAALGILRGWCGLRRSAPTCRETLNA